MAQDAAPPVLIVGAGPTGLTLAITLRLQGIALRIIDQAPQPAAVSKALAVWSGSLEALEALGVMPAFQAAGRRLRALIIGRGRHRLAEVTIGHGIDSPYPYPLLLPQSRTEAILTARLAELGVRVERGVTLTGLTQTAEQVTARLDHGPGQPAEVVTAAYLVGCDGARSTVRHGLGIDFAGYTEPGHYVLGDVKIAGGDLDPDAIYVWWGPGGSLALFPFDHGIWRVTGQSQRGQSQVTGAAPSPIPPPSLEDLQQLIDRYGPPGCRLDDPGWLSGFVINERLAARYRLGRCFLAGDAAHIHSPAGGQGMNTGIQDAVNLGWKLALVLRGLGAREQLLDSYEAERRPIARRVIDGSARRQHLVFARQPLIRLLRGLVGRVVGRSRRLQAIMQAELSETNLVYRHGPLVALGAPPPRPRRTEVGARARDGQWYDPASGAPRSLWPLLSQLRHSLLLFTERDHAPALDAIAPLIGDRLHVLRFDLGHPADQALAQRYHLTGAGWVLIRPDQVVAARGSGGDLAPALPYLQAVLGRHAI